MLFLVRASLVIGRPSITSGTLYLEKSKLFSSDKINGQPINVISHVHLCTVRKENKLLYLDSIKPIQYCPSYIALIQTGLCMSHCFDTGLGYIALILANVTFLYWSMSHILNWPVLHCFNTGLCHIALILA